jgi:SNF2 family DNA or RNA helicase
MTAAKEDVVSTHAKVYEQLKKVRASKEVALKPISMLRKEIRGLDGNLQPLKIRYYQVQAIFHLLSMKRMVLGDATGTGKTVVLIAALCYAWEKEPDNKVIVVCPKSALRQWASEIDKFTTGITVYIVDGSLNERKQAYLEFALHEGPTKAVMVMGYAPLVRDWNQGAKSSPVINGKVDASVPPVLGVLDGITARISHLTIAYDEAAAFKSDSTKTWQVCRQLSERANRCYGLTATLLKNNLIEGFAIYKVIYPQVFSTKTAFLKDYCVTKLQRVAGSRKIPIVVGYKNLQAFRDRIDPFFLGRPKHEISTELPTLITREVACPLSPAEDVKYGEALSGVLSLGDGDVKDYTEHRTLVSLIYCQKTVDSMSLLQYESGDLIDLDPVSGESAEVGKLGAKEQALLDLLTEEFEDDKVIVYCRFTSLIRRLRQICRDAGIETVEVSGDIVDTKSNPARKKAQDAFQDLKSSVRVIFISDAGSEAINLQAASAMIFYDSPWSWGNYVQLLGRPIRIGSPHQHVVAIHLVAERPNRKSDKGRKTIDHYTLEILQKKKALIDKVLGESAVGALEFGREANFTLDLANSLRSSEVHS